MGVQITWLLRGRGGGGVNCVWVGFWRGWAGYLVMAGVDWGGLVWGRVIVGKRRGVSYGWGGWADHLVVADVD